MLEQQQTKRAATGRKKREEVTEQSISSFVTNPEGNVYAVTNLPEEFVAVLFAWVSRSPKSFKEHIKEALDQGLIDYDGSKESNTKLSEKASKFHEKWTVSYGHSSVAEHAVSHVGIEKVSRLASAELELSNRFLSITEYSQRYQQPQRGEWYNPFPRSISHSGPTRNMIDNPKHAEYESFMHRCYDIFEQLVDGVFIHLKEKEKEMYAPASGTWQANRDKELMKLAFEDARYALPLAMYTQLGMTANGRAWRDGIATLANSDLLESQKLALDIKAEITKVLPTLLKHAEPSQYKINSKARTKKLFENLPLTYSVDQPDVHLLQVPSYMKSIQDVMIATLVENSQMSYIDAVYHVGDMSIDQIEVMIQEILFEMGPHDALPEAFRKVKFNFALRISEANWHQLLRHNRGASFVFAQPTVHLGITIPPRIEEAGLSGLLKQLSAESYAAYLSMDDTPYVVLNAHKRQIMMDADLQELYHLISLRTSEEAQWDIRLTFEEVWRHLKFNHPVFAEKAKRR